MLVDDQWLLMPQGQRLSFRMRKELLQEHLSRGFNGCKQHDRACSQKSPPPPTIPAILNRSRRIHRVQKTWHEVDAYNAELRKNNPSAWQKICDEAKARIVRWRL